MNNRGVLILIVVVLIGILVVLVGNYQEKRKSPVEKLGDSVSEVAEEVQDEIDDHTTSR
jgi:preprotein translocase subunit YajC